MAYMTKKEKKAFAHGCRVGASKQKKSRRRTYSRRYY